MAVFLENTCKFNGCGLTYATLSELIQHIEETHLDTDPQILEQQESKQPPYLALSYVFRLFTDVANKEKRPRLSSLSPVSSLRSTTPTGSEFDEDDGRSSEDDSDDSWTTQEEITSEIILSMMTNCNRDSNADKPFACPVPGCKKRYKNINGIKYHAKHGHKKEVRVKKPYKCKCGKSYKTSSGLQSHSLLYHQGNVSSVLSVNAKAATKPKPKQTTAPKTKSGGLVGKLPVAALASQAQARKHVQASLKNLATSMTGIPQAVLTAASNGQPTTALVTVPVTFGKLPAVNGSIKNVKDGGFLPHQQQHMLNLIAPSGLVPPGTTITVPMEQIARNLALLQQVSKAGGHAPPETSPAINSVPGNATNATYSVLSSKDKWSNSSLAGRMAQNIPEIPVPNCMISEEDTSPFAFVESGFEEDMERDDELEDVDICADKSNSDDIEVIGLDSSQFSHQTKEIFPDVEETQKKTFVSDIIVRDLREDLSAVKDLSKMEIGSSA